MADISKITLPDGTTYNIKDATARGYVTGVKGNSESSYRTGNVNLTASNIGAANVTHTHIPTDITTPSSFGQNGMNVISGARIGSYMSNKSFALPANAITIEYSNDAGNTWHDYGATDAQKKDLFTETRATAFYIGHSTTAASKSLNDRLRITISATDRYVEMSMIYLWYSTQGNTSWIDLEYSKFGDPNTFIKVFENQQIIGWSGHNLRYFSIPLFGGSSNAGNTSKIRITFKMTVLSETYPAGIINDIRFYGSSVHSSPNNMVLLNHLYNWDRDLNATFPAKVTATGGFSGNLTGNVTGNATNVTGTVAIANGGTGATTAAGAANAIFNGLPAWTANPTDDTYLPRQDTGGSASYGKVKFSTVWNYIKGKISNILGLTATNYGGTSAKATADASGNTITTYYAPKSTAVTNVALATNKITKTINGSTTDVVTAATTSVYGITKLSTSTSSTATDLAATPSAVKTAYDLANTANGTANTALSGVNGTLIYDTTYSISNGVATFAPHVYLKGAEVTTNYATSCFGWKYRLIDGSEVTLTTKSDRGCDVTINQHGYGGHVVGTFTPT